MSKSMSHQYIQLREPCSSLDPRWMPFNWAGVNVAFKSTEMVKIRRNLSRGLVRYKEVVYRSHSYKRH